MDIVQSIRLENGTAAAQPHSLCPTGNQHAGRARAVVLACKFARTQTHSLEHWLPVAQKSLYPHTRVEQFGSKCCTSSAKFLPLVRPFNCYRWSGHRWRKGLPARVGKHLPAIAGFPVTQHWCATAAIGWVGCGKMATPRRSGWHPRDACRRCVVMVLLADQQEGIVNGLAAAAAVHPSHAGNFLATATFFNAT